MPRTTSAAATKSAARKTVFRHAITSVGPNWIEKNRLAQQELDCALMKHIKSPAAVARLHIEPPAESTGLKVNIVKADELRHLVQESLRADVEMQERELAPNDDRGEEMVMRGSPVS
jgi:hypothetical protein